MPIVGEVVNLYFRFLDASGAPLDITAPEDAPTLYLELNGTAVVNDDAALTATGFEQWWEYAYTATASGEVFARAKTTDSDAAGDGTTDPITFEVSRFGFTGTEGAYKVNSTLDSTERTSIAAAVWDALTSGFTTVGSIGKYLLDKLAPVSAGSITYTNPVNPSTQNLKLYDQDYSEDSGIILPSWEVADWAAFGLMTATDLTLTYLETDGVETPFGELEAVSDTKIQLQITKAEVEALPYGENAAGIIIRATLDADHGEDTVQLVNAALSHYNYVKVPGKP